MRISLTRPGPSTTQLRAVKPIKPALLTLYAGMLGIGSSPAMDEITIIEPLPRGIIRRAAC